MSMDPDPIRTLCPACSCWVETEGYGIPAYVLDKSRTAYHAKCAPEFCTHERRTVRDWKDTDSDTTIFYYKCRDCGEFFDEEVIGSLVRAEGGNG
jgi:hypothetical protein